MHTTARSRRGACLLGVLGAGDTTSLMTLKSSAGANLRPYGVLRDRDGLRMLAKVPAFFLPFFPSSLLFWRPVM